MLKLRLRVELGGEVGSELKSLTFHVVFKTIAIVLTQDTGLILSIVVIESDRSGHGKAEDLGQSPKTAAIVLPSESRLIIWYIIIESGELCCLSSVRAGDLTL